MASASTVGIVGKGFGGASVGFPISNVVVISDVASIVALTIESVLSFRFY